MGAEGFPKDENLEPAVLETHCDSPVDHRPPQRRAVAFPIWEGPDGREGVVARGRWVLPLTIKMWPTTSVSRSSAHPFPGTEYPGVGERPHEVGPVYLTRRP